MNIRKSLVVVAVLSLLAACGNDVGKEDPDPKPDDQNLPLTVQLSRHRVVMENAEGSTVRFVQLVDMKLEGLQGQPYFIIDQSKAPLLDNVEIIEDIPSSGVIKIQLESIDPSLIEPGTHFGELKIHICASVACEKRYLGGPVTVQIINTIFPIAETSSNCPDKAGIIFSDCVDPSWANPYGWQQDFETENFYRYFESDGSLLVNWSILDAALDPDNHGKVLDVKYIGDDARGQLNFSPALYLGSNEKIKYDLSSFSGNLIFDLNVLSWGKHPQSLEIAVECGWPCGTGRIPLEVNELNSWIHFEIPVSDLVSKGLDLKNVAVGFIIGTNQSEGSDGVHFQLDDIRWTGGIESISQGEAGALSVPTQTKAITVSIDDTRNFVWLFDADVPGVFEPVQYVIDTDGLALIDTSYVQLTGEGNAAQIIIDPINPDSSQSGTRIEHAILHACTDDSCTQEYPGSPVELKLIYTVIPNTNSTPDCTSTELGDIFIDCVGASWLDLSAWEASHTGAQTLGYRTFDGTGNFGATWQILDSGLAEHNQVIDILHGTIGLTNDNMQFVAAGVEPPNPHLDLTTYADGNLEFDLNVIDWGTSSQYLEVRVECGWPCVTNPTKLEGMPLNTWTHYSFKAKDLIELGLDLSQVDIGFTISPEYFNSSGTHYQLDNIRWVK